MESRGRSRDSPQWLSSLQWGSIWLFVQEIRLVFIHTNKQQRASLASPSEQFCFAQFNFSHLSFNKTSFSWLEIGFVHFCFASGGRENCDERDLWTKKEGQKERPLNADAAISKWKPNATPLRVMCTRTYIQTQTITCRCLMVKMTGSER